MRDERDERYVRELTARIDAHIAGFSLARKVTYSALAFIPIAGAVYGFNGLLRSCPGSEDFKPYVGFMLTGMITSLFSLTWFLLWFSKFTRALADFAKNHKGAYVFTIIIIVISLKIILHPFRVALEKEEVARCHLPPPRAGTQE